MDLKAIEKRWHPQTIYEWKLRLAEASDVELRHMLFDRVVEAQNDIHDLQEYIMYAKKRGFYGADKFYASYAEWKRGMENDEPLPDHCGPR